MNDRELIKGCIENNRNHQKFFYEKYYSKMFAVCLRYSDGEEEAHKMLQESFIEIYKKLKTLKDIDSIESWIKKNTIISCIKHIRNDKEKRMIVSTVYANKGNNVKIAQKELNDDEIISQTNNEAVLKAIQKLTSGYRIVYNLFLMDGYSHKDIAELLDISEDTSKSNLEKARFNFRKNIVESIK